MLDLGNIKEFNTKGEYEMSTKTSIVKESEIARKWYIVDAKDQILGRFASSIAVILMGKGKPIWSPQLDAGDFVVVVNADKIKVTGKKLSDKKYYKHSGYLGELKTTSLSSLMQKSPETVMMLAVKGMLPHTKLGRKIIKKLKIYKGHEHPHAAQNPESLEV